MKNEIDLVKIGLALAMLTLLFGIGMGMAFGVAEDSFKSYVAEGVAAHAELHDGKSEGKIWRYAQRAHFHAMGIAAVSMGLITLLLFSPLKAGLKRVTALLIGLGGFYPLSWLTMFILGPSIGRDAAHHHLITKLFTLVGVGGLLAGTLILIAGLLFGRPREA